MTADRVASTDEAGRREDDLDAARHRRRAAGWMIGLSVSLLVVMTLAVGIGPVVIGPAEVADIILHHLFGWPRQSTWPLSDNAIVWQIRTPRVILGALVGGGLAAAGAALQAMVRNMLAEPYLLGVTSGASSGAAALILFGVGVSAGIYSLTLTAFAGALAASVAVFFLARIGGRVTSVRLLLGGVAVGYALSALTSFLLFAAPASDQAGTQAVLFFLLGSLTRAAWSSLWAVTIVVIAMLALLTLWGRRLDALAIGDDTCRTLGISPTRLRAQLLVIVALGVGAAVAVSGGIGFVGLVVPHFARRLVGSGHRRVIPIAGLIGAIFLVVADAIARIVIEPTELPIGIVTAFVGVPFLLTLVRHFQPATDS
ncbi:FecCD family ABC transporter permease [Streptomyces sp. 8L]|uniref:FecCD family ABC transporter permease n=1 Tax=Streptomyces sp. 8L TaxID=2877242 RepID=UPI001CD5A46F|nr:iron ABC transporter permease [Streptomyces sp. 8L]MCA1222318.1 iron ABC transporter permease [Streptomyces sp. 8L]